MRQSLRIALPPLARLTPESDIAWALLDRHGRLLRSGEQRLEKLTTVLPVRQAAAILHPDDAVVATVEIPPLPAARLKAAVQARIEPMALSDLQELALAHGPRLADGRIQLAWASRRSLRQGWQLLSQAGLDIQALIPHELALPPGDPQPHQALSLPVDSRWLSPLPAWSLALPEWRPARAGKPWRSSLRWVAAAALLWLVGLHLHAAQLRSEVQTLQLRMEDSARAAFPAIPAWLDPLRQAQGQVEQLRLAHGQSAPDDFIPLALSAAQVLNGTAGYVTALHYQDQQLTLTLAEGHELHADASLLQREAAANSLLLSKDAGQPQVWRMRRDDQPGEARP